MQIVYFNVDLSSHRSHEFFFFFLILTLLLSIARVLLTFDEGCEGLTSQGGFLVFLLKSELVLEDIEGVCRVVRRVRLIRFHAIVVYVRKFIGFITSWRSSQLLISVLS